VTEISRHEPPRRNNLVPELRIDFVPTESLKSANRQTRRKEAAQARRLDRSIAKFGITAPISVDGEDRIVHGHGIWEAARRAGCSTVPVIRITHLSPVELRLLGIALNRLGETGAWDEAALRLEFEELIDLGEDVVLSGFEPPEVDFLLLGDNEAEAVEGGEGDIVPEPSTESVSQSGDCWVLRRHRLFQGDAREPAVYQRLILEGEEIRIVLTDIPFNVPIADHVTGDPEHREFAMASGEMSREEFEAFIEAWIAACLPYLADGGLLSTFIDWRSVELVLACGRAAGLSLLNLVVWSKTNGGQGSLWRSQHELLPIFKKGRASHVNNVELGRWGRWRSNVWVYPGGSSLGSDSRDGLALHPTVKPRALLEDALLDVTNRDEVVLDPFLGSGSTLLAAESTGRICRAVEIDGPYCDVAIRRWQDLTGEQAVLEATGQTFGEVARERFGDPGEAHVGKRPRAAASDDGSSAEDL
jgi:DNA modification methylase